MDNFTHTNNITIYMISVCIHKYFTFNSQAVSADRLVRSSEGMRQPAELKGRQALVAGQGMNLN